MAKSDQTIVITGPTSGIGRVMAQALGGPGVRLILACRDEARGQQVAQEVAAGTGAEVEVRQVDVASQSSLRAFAQGVRADHSQINVLINNAGANTGPGPRQFSPEGIELTAATNVLAYHLLTRELLSLLRAAAPARIVNVASEFASDLDLDDLQFERRPFNSTKAYAQSKACDRLLTWAWARRLASSGVTANAMTPGLVVETGLYRNAAPELMARLRQRGGRTVAQGADTAIWLAASPEAEGLNGQFFYERREIPCQFRGDAAEEKLWGICEALVGAAA